MEKKKKPKKRYKEKLKNPILMRKKTSQIKKRRISQINKGIELFFKLKIEKRILLTHKKNFMTNLIF